jgi:iron complex outermembrane receptor protein
MSTALRFATALAVALSTQTLRAQDTATPSAASAPSPGPAAKERVEELVVTAQRVEQNVQDVPISIEAVTGDEVDQLSLRDLTEVQSLTTGLYITPAVANSVTTLRGVAFDPYASTQSTVDYYWNDTPIESEGALRSLFDVQQVEVVKGPQATLRGGSAPSGAITVATRRPSLEQMDGFLETQFSDNGQKLVQGAFGAPLIQEKLGLRLAGLYETNDGDSIENPLTDIDQNIRTWGARATLLAQLTDALKATLAYQYLEVDNRGFEDVWATGTPAPGNPVTGPFSRKAVQEFSPHFGNTLHYVTLALEYELDDNHRISAIGSYNKNRRVGDNDLDMGNAIPNFGAVQKVRTDYPFSFAEVRVESLANERWNWMVGADFRYADTHTTVDQADRSYFNFLAPFGIPGPFPTDGAIDFLAALPPGTPVPTCFAPPTFRPCNLIGYADQLIQIDIPTSTREIAMFTRQSFAITENTLLEAALRYRTVRSKRDSPATISLPQLFTTLNQNFIPPAFREDDTHAWTGSVSLSHHFTEAFMAYFSYGHGFRLGSSSIVTNAFPPGSTAPIFEDETNDAIEIGFKTELFDGRARVNGAFFYQMFDGFQSRIANIATDSDANGCFGPDIPYADPTVCQTPSTGDGNDRFAPGITFNAPATVKGFELEMDAVLIDNWTANLGVTWAEAEFDNGAHSPCNVVDANGDHLFVAEDGSPAGGFGVASCSRSGPLGNIPEFTLSATTEYTLPIGSFEAYGRLLARYNGEHQNDALVVPQKFDGYGLVNLYLGVRHPEQGWDVTLWAKNVADREEVIDVSDPLTYSVFPTGYSTVTVPRGREFGVTLRYDFSI